MTEQRRHTSPYSIMRMRMFMSHTLSTMQCGTGRCPLSVSRLRIS